MAKSQPTIEPRTRADAAGLRHSINCHDRQAGLMEQAEQQRWLLAAGLHVRRRQADSPAFPQPQQFALAPNYRVRPSTHARPSKHTLNKKRSPVSTRSTALRVEPFESLILQLTQGRCLGALQLRHCQVEDKISKLSPLHCAIGVGVDGCG